MPVLTLALGICLYLILFSPEPASDDHLITVYRDSAEAFKRSAEAHQQVADRLADSLVQERSAKLAAVAARRRAESRLDSALTAADSVLADTSATKERLWAALQTTTLIVRQYKDTVAEERSRFERESVLQANQIIELRSTIADQAGQIRSKDAENLRIIEKYDCKIFGRECPTRKQSFLGGMGIMGVILTILVL